ncbi:winged helix-turn-helix transcriptional regulator [Allokutzneria oryzae]|uniref:Winged helix-turn-helix transcriptional regulator n=1 Tax=Allokutzneria oryzae TaxID=1378989 RepID=A0ABV6A8G5_9PSEU
MALGKNYDGQECALAAALGLLGERWTLLVVRDAFYGVRRYSDFLAHLDVPRAVLADRLQALVDAGVLEKQRYQESPPRDEYVLTERGEELWPVLHRIARWGERNMAGVSPRRLFRHTECGTRIDPSGHCPACGGEIPPAEVETVLAPEVTSSRRDDPVTKALAAGPHRLLEPLLPRSS